jgi:2-succinyl-6-hydroxy-2,4-cyclohexadiene-1-carboxylate synthase
VTVVLLHGFAHTPASWREVIDALAPALDEPLFACPNPGHSADVAVGAGWAATIDALAARVPPDAIAIGYSLGARLALGLLARDAVAAAVLIGVHPGLDDEAERAARRAADARWSALLRTGGTAAFLDAWEAQPIFATAARAPAAVRAERRAARARLDAAGLADAMDVLGLGAMPPLGAALAARADRAHLIAGADDAKFRALAEALPPARTIIPASGHDVTLEAPAALAAALTGAIARWR